MSNFQELSKTNSAQALGDSLASFIKAKNEAQQIQNQTLQTQYQNPNRPVSDRDIIELAAKDYAVQSQFASQTGKVPNLLQLIKGYKDAFHGVQQPPPQGPAGGGMMSPQAQTPIMSGNVPGLQVPMGAGGGQPQFMSPAQMAVNPGVWSNNQVPQQIPVQAPQSFGGAPNPISQAVQSSIPNVAGAVQALQQKLNPAQAPINPNMQPLPEKTNVWGIPEQYTAPQAQQQSEQIKGQAGVQEAVQTEAQKVADQSKRNWDSYHTQSLIVMNKWKQMSDRNQELIKQHTGLDSTPGRAAGIGNVVFGATGENEYVKSFENSVTQAVTANIKAIAPGARPGPDLIKMFDKSYPSVWSTKPEATDKVATDLALALGRYVSSNPDEFPVAPDYTLFENNVKNLLRGASSQGGPFKPGDVQTKNGKSYVRDNKGQWHQTQQTQ